MNNIQINVKDIQNRCNVSFREILLSSNNPRFTLINSINSNLVDFIKNEADELNQQEIFTKLLKNEGNFSDLLRLLKNIHDFGFNNNGESIYLVKNKEWYVVAEGNRRVMCLCLIINKFEFPKFDDLSIYISNYSNNIDEEINKNEYVDLEESEFKIMKNNYYQCISMVEKIREKYKNKTWDLFIEIIDDSDLLWKTIYDKHLTGERPGIRQWSRTKYYADLLNIFKDGIYIDSGINELNNDSKLIFQRIRREPKMVIRDFQEAQYIYSLFYFYRELNNGKEIVDNFHIPEILNEMISLNRPSALERNHSFNKIKKLFCSNNSFVDEKKFDEDYIKIDFQKQNGRMNISYKLVKPSLFFSFIVEKWLKKELTTRPFKNETKILLEFQSNVLKGINFSKKLELEDLKKIDEFEISLESLENLIDANIHYYDDKILKPFKKAKIFRLKLEEIFGKISSKISSEINENNIFDTPKYIFILLFEQLKWNFSETNKRKFLNAASVSIRSFFEQLILWIYTNYQENQKNKYDYLIKLLCNGRINKFFNQLKESHKKENETFLYDQIYFDSLNDVVLSKMFRSIMTNDEVLKSLVLYVKSLLFDDNKWELLNEHIHASHRIYYDFENTLGIIQESYDIFEKILGYINFNNLSNLSKAIQRELKDKNQ